MKLYKPNYPTYIDEYGVIYSEQKKQLIRCPLDFKGEYHVLEGVVSIRQESFAGCRDLTAVYLPCTIGRIEADVFKGCRRLKRIYIPNDEFSIAFFMNALEKYSKILYVLGEDGHEIKPEVSEKFKLGEVDEINPLNNIKEYLQSLGTPNTRRDIKDTIIVLLVLIAIFACLFCFIFGFDFWISLLASFIMVVGGFGIFYINEWLEYKAGEGGYDGGYNDDFFDDGYEDENNDDFN